MAARKKAKRAGKGDQPEPTPEEVRQTLDEAHERHLAFFFDPDPDVEIAPVTVAEYRFEVAITNLRAMLEAHEYIGVDWGHDEKGEATLANRPYPGTPLPKRPSFKHAVRNYRCAVRTHRDCEELAAQLSQIADVKRLRAVLARMAWYLDGGQVMAAEDLARGGSTKEAIGVLREALHLAHDECVHEMKEILSRIDLDDVGLDKAEATIRRELDPEAPVLVDTDWQILRYLSESESPMIQKEIAEGVSKGDGTVKASVQTLERHGYIDRPCGQRKGYGITPRGQDRLTRAK
ncbi:MAG: winged helix-turn-helix domain-containing protein [Lentisphaerae bacterium]|nr:winged helix-turn-helix domain-containing protein [Lentisphaerota bacterium]